MLQDTSDLCTLAMSLVRRLNADEAVMIWIKGFRPGLHPGLKMPARPLSESPLWSLDYVI